MNPTPSLRALLDQATVAISQLKDSRRDLAQRLAVVEAASREPIAIVGLGCRYPGGVTDPDSFWHVLEHGVDAVAEVPGERWDIDALYDPDPDAIGKMMTRSGGFVMDIDRFDPAFFGISRREAASMDPQQRLLLETSWEAFEHAGIAPDRLAGSSTGVFVGLMYQEYGRLAGGLEQLDGFIGTGNGGSAASGRISYTLGLQGPSITVDTACSSSLVAVHLACQALRQRECSLAIAGGVALMLTPVAFVEFSRLRGLAPDGRCKSFAAAADGVGWAEGCGMLVLERLSDARHHGHQVLALIRGSAVNQDGRSNGMTAPNGPSQAAVIRRALAGAGVVPADVQYVECHGTGTPLGDPIEVQALGGVLAEGRDPDRPVVLGSVKTNFGHTQAAAGAAGIIKVVLALEHGLIPKNLHFDAPSPHIPWDELPVTVATAAVPWPANGTPRIAGVSSFGVSGTNAHLVLAEAPSSGGGETGALARPPRMPIQLSGKTELALRDQARRLRRHLAIHPGADLTDLAYSLATRRSAFAHRAVVMSRGREDLPAALEALGDGRSHPSVALGQSGGGGKLAVLFTGQGSQRPGMGRGLYDTFPVFRDALNDLCGRFDRTLERPLRDVVFAAEGSDPARALDETVFTQPALFALEVALFRLLETWGLRPDLLLGHSIGELVAAHVAGILSIDDACTLVAARGRLMHALPRGGAMVHVQAAEHEVLAVLGDSGRASIAALNGPSSTVVAGAGDAVAAVESHFQALGRKTSRLRVSHAFHSPQMEPMLEAFGRVADGLTYHRATIPIVSNVSGALASGRELGSAEAWVRHVRRPVRFLDGMRTLHAEGVSTFLELGPDGVLSGLGAGALPAEALPRAAFLPALRRDRPDLDAFAAALGTLHARGHEIDWAGFFEPFAPRAVALPTYAFQRERFWLAPRDRDEPAAAPSGDHPWLGPPIALAEGDGVVFLGRVSLLEHPWLADHTVFGAVVLPGTAFVELALAAGHRIGLPRLDELVIEAPLVLPTEGAIQLQLLVGPPDAEGRRPLTVFARLGSAASDPWMRHATGSLGPAVDRAPARFAIWPPADATPLALDGLYERLADAGLAYGRAFQNLGAAWRHGDELFAEVRLQDGAADRGRFGVHPAVLDAALHAFAAERDAARADVNLPFAWTGVSLHARAGSTLRVRLSRSSVSHAVALDICDGSGEPVVSVNALVLRPASAERLGSAASAIAREAGLYRVDWIAPATSSAPRSERWAVLGDRAGDVVSALGGSGIAVDHHADVAALRAALDESAPRPDVIVVTWPMSPLPGGPASGPEGSAMLRAVHDETQRGLALLRAWLSEDRLSSCRLVVATYRAVATGADEDVVDLVHAPLWGLFRTAQLEYPDRPIVLVDLDEHEASTRALPLALTSDEPQLAVRQGRVRAPRLARALPVGSAPRRRFDPAGTVLITGGTGMLGGLVARHLVETHGVRYLVLASRRGDLANGAEALGRELTAAGASVTLASCDVADRDALVRLLAAIPEAHPLTAVVHAAGALDDGVLLSATRESFDRVLKPKLDAALHLHELTEKLDLAAFVLFSSISGVLGAAGQASYAAANAFLDALAHHRNRRGLPAVSLAWGYWAERSEMTAHLSDADVQRMAREGLLGLSNEDGLRLFDLALSRSESCLVPAAVAGAALQTRADSLPPILRGLARATARRRAADGERRAGDDERRAGDGERRAAGGERSALLTLGSEQRRAALLQILREEAASELGLGSTEEIALDRSLLTRGLNSLSALAIRRRLAARVGARLPASWLLDAATVADAASSLFDAFASPELGPDRPDQPVTDAPRPPAASRPPTGRLASLYREAIAIGKPELGLELLEIASRMRRTSDQPAGPDAGPAGGPAAIRLARGSSLPSLLCIPSLALPTGPIQYSRLAAALDPQREVWVIRNPGYVAEEPLPASLSAAVEQLANAVEECASAGPFALAGVSSGGWLAHALTSHLEARGLVPRALVLLDTYVPGRTAARMMSALQDGWMNFDSSVERLDAELTAMCWYFRLFRDWAPAPITTPILFARASDPLPGVAGDDALAMADGHWRARWDQPHTLVDVPGNHFTLIGEHADATARVVHDWLAALRVAPSTRRQSR